MRSAFVLVALGLVAVLTGCDAVSEALPFDSLACGGTDRDLCQAVSRVAIAQMNRAATGPITNVTLTPGDCDRLGRSHFHSDWRFATDCWEVEVTGERSHGGGVVIRHPDGTLEPFW